VGLIPQENSPEKEAQVLRVEVVTGPMDGLAHFTTDGAMLIGRGPECDLSLDSDSTVAEKHARLWLLNGLVWIEDLGTNAGTWIGSEPIQGKLPVSSGVVFCVGNTLVEIVADDGGEV
jgi:pSer/pThr/pTyr-binding forkhead associated (FHA) protein